MSFLTGKPAKSTSSSVNTNNDLIKSTYGSTMDAGTGATSNINALLTGKGDVAGAQSGYTNYLQQAGYAPAMKALASGVTGQGAAAGILNSGTTAKALQSRGADLNQSYFNNYLQNLSGLSAQGLQAGGLVANAGQTSQSTQTGATGGLFGALSQAAGVATGIGKAAAVFSDRRLKTDIEKVGEYADGLGIYEYRYKGIMQRVRGVMADEVAKLRPWALGPKSYGFATVNYGVL